MLQHEQVKVGNDNIQSNLELAGVQFNHAVALLHSDQHAQRTAGVYSLQRIARFAPSEVPTILEVLAGFVRARAPLPDPTDQSEDNPVEDAVQAALTVIGTLHKSSEPLNLTRIDLCYATLDGDFSGVDFSYSVLWSARMSGVFVGARFLSCMLKCADLRGARMAKAELSKANLEEADLSGADLLDARTDGATFASARCDTATVFPVGFSPGANLIVIT